MSANDGHPRAVCAPGAAQAGDPPPKGAPCRQAPPERAGKPRGRPGEACARGHATGVATLAVAGSGSRLRSRRGSGLIDGSDASQPADHADLAASVQHAGRVVRVTGRRREPPDLDRFVAALLAMALAELDTERNQNTSSEDAEKGSDLR